MAGVSGRAIGLATGGGLLLYSALSGNSIPVALRSVLSTGTLPAPVPGTPAAPVNTAGQPIPSATGSRIADDFLSYVGKVPYRWGGASPAGWDCSGAVTYVLHHDMGLSLPDNSHTVCMQFYNWSGAVKVSTPVAGCIVLWPSHMGIAIDSTRMVSALNPKRGTCVTTFRDGGPIPWSEPTFLQVTGV
jgi:cell wall-associated NlpC family hydrolase